MVEPGPIRDWRRIAVEMLMTDADLALLTVSSLFSKSDREAVTRLVGNAREVYDAVCLRRKEIELSHQESARLDDKLDQLRTGLRFFGEVV